MSIATEHRDNFDTLRKAFIAGEAALLECQLVATGQVVPVVCAVNHLPKREVEFVPLAMLFHDNPYQLVNPPNPDGGFHTQQEVHGEPSD